MLRKYQEKIKASIHQPVPLRLALIAPFIIEIFAVVGLTGWLSWRNSQKAVNDLATQLRNSVSARIQQYLENYLEKPVLITKINADAFKQGQLSWKNPLALERYLWQQIQLFSTVRSNYFGNKEGGINLITREDDGAIVARITENFPQRITYSLDSQGNRLQRQRIDQNYDARTRPWYKAAIKNNQQSWEIYTFTYGHLGITVSQPAYDSSGIFQGVFAVDLSLSYISDFLRNIKISPNAQTFIIERSGYLIASSDSQPFTVNADGKQKRLLATESPTILIKSATQELNSKFGSLKNVNQAEKFDFGLNNEHLFAQVLPYQDTGGLDWLVVVVVPEKDFMEQINANTRTTIMLCIAALGVAILLGVLTAQWIAQPIQNLVVASTAIACGELNQNIEAASVKELNVLAVSFRQMAGQLQTYFTALEQSKNNLEIRVQERTIELTHALEELQQAQLQLIQSEKMSSLGQLMAGIAHEINNPVGFIHTNLPYTQESLENLLALVKLYQQQFPNPTPEIKQQQEIADLEFLQEDLPKLLASMQVGTERIKQIVLSLRTFSRLDEAAVKAVDLHEGLESALLILEHRLQSQLNRPGIQVIKSYGNLPMIECWAAQINQVFLNILSNGIDAIDSRYAMDTGDANSSDILLVNETDNVSKSDRLLHISIPQITIVTEFVKANFAPNNDEIGNKVVISIADNGIGISEDIKGRLFDPFFTTKPVGKGTGLGLSIAYQIIVEQHGGSLKCNSVIGQGTEFLIEIPVKNSIESSTVQQY
ncbi:sensor protein [Oscillatoriales cyanobacterium USR001]|nr:sensor protein [Oscillatoriales cyanobacterium USR001]